MNAPAPASVARRPTLRERQAALAAQAQAALRLADLCQRRGYELEMAGTSGVYVVTRRQGTAVWITAGEPAEVLDAVAAGRA